MSLVLPKVLTSTQNTQLNDGFLNEARLPGPYCTLRPSIESTQRCWGDDLSPVDHHLQLPVLAWLPTVAP